MKRFTMIFLAAMLVFTGIPCIPMSTQAADRKLWATVGDNNTHLLPEDYAVTLDKYKNGKLTEVRSWSGWAWKNDHANSRLDFLTLDEDIPEAELVWGDFKSADGNVINKENIKVSYLSKVNTKCYAYPNIDYDVFDIISEDVTRDLKAGELHEAWVDIYVPENTPAGIYKGTISLESNARRVVDFAYEIEVLNLTLTDPEDWETYFELWETPFAAARYYSGLSDEDFFQFTTTDDTNPYSLYYMRLDKKYEPAWESQLELYHQAGGNSITVHIVEGPDNSRKPCATPSLIKWTKKADGHFEFDYSDMDYWIELNMKHGINRQINLMSLVGVGYGFVYFDEATGKVAHTYGGGPGTAEWTRICQEFLRDLIPHLEEKGWFDLCVLNMDERTLSWTTALLDVAQTVKNSKDQPLKVGGAVNAGELESIFDRLYDISIWENVLPDNIEELSESRRQNGQQTTIYTCGAGKMASTCRPEEAAYAVYESFKRGTDGVMRWALDKFDEDPLYAEFNDVCYPGDCYLIYPSEKDSVTMQARSTPRFEKLCEGMRDVEKLRIIAKDPTYADAVNFLRKSIGYNKVGEVKNMRSKILALCRNVISFSNGQFKDTISNAWYNEAVGFAVASSLMTGVSPTEFSPNTSMTRAMFVTVLARMDGGKIDNEEKSIFIDVPTGKWYSGAIAWGTRRGILNGVEKNKFAPNAALTREQTATLLYRYAKSKKYDITETADITGYKDYNKISEYAREAIAWANAKGIMKGVSDTTLDPRGNCTRAQIAEMFRFFTRNVLEAKP